MNLPLRSLLFCLPSAFCLFLLPGCTSPPQKLMGDGFHDEMSGWGEKNRPADDASGDFSGVSTKSQQVERDLGVR
jgi:hypothetical protein